MTPLEEWMTRAKETDATLATKAGVSRVQISRLRRAKGKPSLALAVKLEGLTGIPVAKLAA